MNNTKKNYITILVKVITNSSRNKFSDVSLIENGSISIRAHLTALPEKGKANASLIKLFAKILKVRNDDIEILRGHTKNKKSIGVCGIGHNEILLLLQNK